MTLFDNTIKKAQEYFPDIQIKFKNESTLMKIIGTILFFNPSFMTKYITTLGSTVYFQNRDFVNNSPDSATIVFLHELVHINDAKKENKILFSFLYLIPQIFVLLSIPLLFLFGWKIALFSLLFLAPLPAYFRMKDERKAYTISLYVMGKLNKNGYNINIDKEKDFFISQFKGGGYYFMWPFKSIDVYFNDVVDKIKSENRPTNDNDIYDMLDKILVN